MKHAWLFLMVSACLLGTVSCSKREVSDADTAAWDEIQPIAGADTTGKSIPAVESVSAQNPSRVDVLDGEFAPYQRRLEEMKDAERKRGQVLLSGDRLVLDYLKQSVLLDGHVVVTDDQGALTAAHLQGRFTASNQVDQIQASGGVTLDSSGYRAKGEKAVYNYLGKNIQLEGLAEVSEGENRFSGERITVWVDDGGRKVLCEPNAVLSFSGETKANVDVPEDFGATEIRAGRIFYDETRQRIDLTGNVRLRNDRVAVNCESVFMVLKDGNEIDWIEAAGGVIIQSVETRALAKRAVYDADKGNFTLEGEPIVMRGKNVMTGARIIYWLDTQSVLCEPQGRVLLHLDDETRAKLLKDLND